MRSARCPYLSCLAQALKLDLLAEQGHDPAPVLFRCRSRGGEDIGEATALCLGQFEFQFYALGRQPQAPDAPVGGIGLLAHVTEIDQPAQRLMQVLLGDPHNLQQFADAAIRVPADEVKQAVVNPA